MTRNNADFHQFREEPHPGIAEGNVSTRMRRLSLVGTGSYIDYGADGKLPNGQGIQTIDAIRSSEEGKGHATALLHRLYQQHPKDLIDWQMIIHPAAEHLYGKFKNTYGRSSHWGDDLREELEDD